jgi:hypothetical protein
MIKRTLAPVLALVAFGMTATASIATYCDGTGCSPNNAAQFTSDLATDDYTLQGIVTFSALNGTLSGSTYTDTTTGIVFADFHGHNLAFSGSGLTTPIGQTNDFIRITLPATYLAIQFNVNVPAGLCLNAACPANQTTGFVGFINPGVTDTWFVDIGPLGAQQFTDILNFNAATLDVNNTDTPEIGTLLLIGTGLIVMRWMKRRPRHFFRTPQTA